MAVKKNIYIYLGEYVEVVGVGESVERLTGSLCILRERLRIEREGV